MYNVFIADDEPFIIEGLYSIIDWEKIGFKIVGNAENGKETLEALKRVPVDLLITDISMPVMDGLTSIREARKMNPNLKVMILSGYDEFAYVKQGLQLGIENYLLKPVNIEELTSSLHSIVDKLNSEQHHTPLLPQDISILRDHVMYRWLTNQISEQELNERISLLELTLDAPFVQVCVIRSSHIQTEVHDYVSHQVAGEEQVICFRDLQGDTVLLFKLFDPEDDRRKMRVILQNLAISWEGDEALRITLGSVEPLQNGASISYKQALHTHEYFLIHPHAQILEYDDVFIAPHDERTEALKWPEYSALLFMKNKRAFLEQVEEDFKRMRQIEGMTPRIIQHTTAEFLIRLKTELDAIKHSQEHHEQFEGYLFQASEAETFEELVNVVKEAAEHSVDLLNHNEKSPIVHQVLHLIHDCYAKPLSLKSLGKDLNIHPVYLGKVFHKEMGQSFSDYLNQYRIGQAKKMLHETNMKVHEIANQIGYWDSGYFYKQFKKYVGISPTDYKNLK